jgi:hypothetical protein
LIVAKSNLLSPCFDGDDPALLNSVEVRTTPAIWSPKRAPSAAAEIVPRLVPMRNTGLSGKRFLTSATTAEISVKWSAPRRKSSPIPSPRC